MGNTDKRLLLTCAIGLCTSLLCLVNMGVSASIIPQKPLYSDTLMWCVVDSDETGTGADVFYIVSTWEEDWLTPMGDTRRYADVWNPVHRGRMAKEIKGVANYMAPGNRFYAPYYRHSTIEGWMTQNEDTIYQRTRISMGDVCDAFDYFLSQRDAKRPFILAGFSQGGMAVVELLKHMDDATYQQMVAAYVMGYKVTPRDTAQCKRIRPALHETDTGVTICYNSVKDVKYVKPVIAATCMGINPVNWHTDETPAILADTIQVSLDCESHVLVVRGYAASEYRSYRGFINVGDIHSCEPWLYRGCIAENMKVRTKYWRKGHGTGVE